MFLRNVLLVLFVAILGTSWFSGEGLVAAKPIVQYQRASGYNAIQYNGIPAHGNPYEQPVYTYPHGQPVYPNPYEQPVYPNYQIEPMGYYQQPSYGDPRKYRPLIRGWDTVHDYGQNYWFPQ